MALIYFGFLEFRPAAFCGAPILAPPRTAASGKRLYHMKSKISHENEIAY